MPRYGARIETPEEFHRRIIERCEVLAARYEREAAESASPETRQTILAKAAAERRYADLHRAKLAAFRATRGEQL
jgi:hypothetical protein